jgi:hypothetical protein
MQIHAQMLDIDLKGCSYFSAMRKVTYPLLSNNFIFPKYSMLKICENLRQCKLETIYKRVGMYRKVALLAKFPR